MAARRKRPSSIKLKKARDWRALDAAHRRRGELVTLVFAEDAPEAVPPAKTGARGRPRAYSDELIEALLTAKAVLRLSLRALEGFAAGLCRLTGARWRVPDYSTISLREKDLRTHLPPAQAVGKHVFVVDATGLKVFGEGEWKTRTHGVGKRRTWRKVHLLVDRESGHILSVELTEANVHDSEVLADLLVPTAPDCWVLGDGAYHTTGCHRMVFASGATLLSPPPRRARVWRRGNWREEPALAFRNSQLTRIRRLGRRQWKMKTGYSQRSFVESTNHRLKSITGDRLAARTFDRQRVEVRLRCEFLNKVSASTWQAPA